MKEIERIQIEESIHGLYIDENRITPASLQELFLKYYDAHPELLEDTLYLQIVGGYDDYDICIKGLRWETDKEFERRKVNLMKIAEKNLVQQLKQEEKARKLYEQLKKKFGE